MVESLRQEVDSSRTGVASAGEIPESRRAVRGGVLGCSMVAPPR